MRVQRYWQDGFWTVEFARKLQTGHGDGVQFSVGDFYLFAVSLEELAFDAPHPEYSRPLYRSGDVYERIILKVLPAR